MEWSARIRLRKFLSAIVDRAIILARNSAGVLALAELDPNFHGGLAISGFKKKNLASVDLSWLLELPLEPQF